MTDKTVTKPFLIGFLQKTCIGVAVFVTTLPVYGQAVQQSPVVDSATEASPVAAATASAPAVDAAANASPVFPTPSGDSIPAKTQLHLKLGTGVSSASAHNGQTLTATLLQPVHTASGKTLAAGTTATITVIAAVPAGKMSSGGQLSLQVTHVGAIAVLSDMLEEHGSLGDRQRPDSIPTKGTEASIAAGAQLNFTIPATPKI